MGARTQALLKRRPAAAAALLAALAAVASLLAPAAAPAAAAPATLDAGNGSTLVVEPKPFRLSVRDARTGEERVGTVAGLEGAPVRLPGIDGPQPVEPFGAAGGFPAFGFVVGASPGVTFPVSFFTGNRLFGAEAGGLVSVVEATAVRPTATGLELDLRTDAPGAPAAAMTIDRLPGGGVKVDLRPPREIDPVATVFTLRSPEDEGLYGLGARKDVFNQRGRLRNVWVEQQNSADERLEPIPGADPTGTFGEDYTFPNGPQAGYFVQAALHGSRGWAAWVGQTALSRVDLAASRADAIRWGVKSPGVTLSLAGGGLEPAAKSYTAAVGRAPAPPRYVYEPWIDVINQGDSEESGGDDGDAGGQSEAAPNGAGFNDGARVRRDLEDLARQARELDLPIGTLGVEGWHNVPGGEELFESLREQGFHLSAYWNPFHAEGQPATEDARKRGIFIKDPKGDPYPIVTNRGNRSFVIDYSNPKALDYWKEQIERSCSLGFEAFMHDFGEIVTEGMTFANGNPPEVEHNAYPVRYHRAARAALDACAQRRQGFDPFFYVRAGYSGIGDEPGVIASTSSVFPGDETTDYSQGSGIPSVPPAMLNMAMGGGYTFTTDVGGYLDLYTPRTSEELFIRWSQLAAFTAVSRSHNSTSNGSVYPDTYGEPQLSIYRRYAKAKVKLIPLVDEWSKRAADDGTIGPVRPLVLDDPSPAARSIDDEWLLGSDILVAPVLERGATERKVYLPAGSRWQRVVVGEDGSLVAQGVPADGGQTITAPAPLEDIPLFQRVKGGAAQPAPNGAGAGPAATPPGRTDAGNKSNAGSRPRGSGGRGRAGDDDDRGRGSTRVRARENGGEAGNSGGGSLPFTGFAPGWILLAATALLVAGLALRRAARSRP